ncbi:hypothetical protein [Arthrobacter sp. MYb224]|uniref:hypothetical protein n=1 Tax=Arthrobacter sp. MYb224 TaxID=1848600 RepID=UPI0011AFE158|nr:hypothetical protein [Arthrobacter sp. MYb224]
MGAHTLNMRSSRNFWSPWWAQIVAGLFVVLLAVAPWLWLWLGQRDESLLPAPDSDAAGLIIVFSLVALLGGWFARIIGRRATSFAILTDVGMMLSLLGLAAHWILGGEPNFLQGGASPETQRELWVFGTLLVISQILYFVIAKLRLSVVALLVAVLAFSVGQWMQMVATYTPADPNIYSSLTYAGPLLLGFVLGFLGFLRAWHLVLWIIALAIQWIMPAVISAVVTILENPEGSWGASLSRFGELTVAAVRQSDWIIPALVTLATAMLVSVILLIVRKVRRRSY